MDFIDLSLQIDYNEEFQELMDFFNGMTPRGAFTNALQKEVSRVKASQEWRREYMTPNELLSDTSDYQDKWDVDYMLVDDTSEDYILLQQYHTLAVAKRARLMGYLQALCQPEK
ncbi:MAG: hypothetical protein K2L07_04140 [Lachnospiraceae bacterium]|nr:hypothetical protein [Lachnospiraceae bacterium]